MTTHVNYIPQSSCHHEVDTFSTIWVTFASSWFQIWEWVEGFYGGQLVTHSLRGI